MATIHVIATRAAAALLLFASSPAVCAQGGEAAGSGSKPTSITLPVMELTAFKDGHAFVRCETALPADAGGRVVLEELPKPVLGTFWPYALNGATLVAARAGRVETKRDHDVTTLLELAEANIGAVVVADVDGESDDVTGRLRAVRKSGKKGLLMIETPVGVLAVPSARLLDLRVPQDFKGTLQRTEQKKQLVLSVQGGDAKAKVGVLYVQKGFRWIPSYHIDLDGSGTAEVRMQATLVNDLVDLEGASVQLVVGVPKFAFADMVDPISLQQQMAQLASANAQNFRFDNSISNVLSNSLMTQVPSSGGARTAAADPKVEEGDGNEDLYVIPVRNITLKKGERMVVPVATFSLPYTDVYRLDVALAPPADYRRGLQDQRAQQLARELSSPRVRHLLRLENTHSAPLTTSPALVLNGGRILGQAHLKYAARGASTDLELNVAIDVQVDSSERETGRKGNVLMDGTNFRRIEIAGTTELTNRKGEAIEVEVQRRILGLIDEAGQGGVKRQLDLQSAWDGAARPDWWSWWSWPWWCFQHNGVGEVTWNVTLQPGESAKLEASWHYFWR
ncbi:MAG: hypothetical protein AB8H80_19190 [Planctomycetota bacterium]